MLQPLTDLLTGLTSLGKGGCKVGDGLGTGRRTTTAFLGRIASFRTAVMLGDRQIVSSSGGALLSRQPDLFDASHSRKAGRAGAAVGSGICGKAAHPLMPVFGSHDVGMLHRQEVARGEHLRLFGYMSVGRKCLCRRK